MTAPADTTQPDPEAQPFVGEREDYSAGAAFFDVDRTLIAGGAALRLARPFREHGLLTRRQQLRAGIMQIGFMLRGADDHGIERFAAAARDLVGGWGAAEVRDIVATDLAAELEPVVYREALERIELHRRLGQRVYAISATIVDIVEPLAELLGLDGALGSELEEVDGKYTGEITRICHGAAKAERLHEFAAEHDIDLSVSCAYSDSISDEPLLRAVGRPYAVNPDRALRKLAEAEGWGILNFRTRQRLPLHKKRSTRFAVVAVAAAVISGVAVRLRRR